MSTAKTAHDLVDILCEHVKHVVRDIPALGIVHVLDARDAVGAPEAQRSDDDEQRPAGRSRAGFIPHPTRRDIEGSGGQTAFEAVGQGRR